MQVMVEKSKKVVLHVEVDEATRTRIRMEAVRRGVTMGEVVDMLFSLAMPQLEESDRA